MRKKENRPFKTQISLSSLTGSSRILHTVCIDVYPSQYNSLFLGLSFCKYSFRRRSLLHTRGLAYKDKPGRQIRAKRFTDCVESNIVTRYSKQHSRCYKVISAKTDQVRNSFFYRTVIDWNNLDSRTVNSQSVECFQRNLNRQE